MPTAFNRAEARNKAESNRLHQLIANLQLINNGARFPGGWLSVTGGLSGRNIERIKRANQARKANPANYNKEKLQKKVANLATKTLVSRWMYGYVPKRGANWVKKNGIWVPPHLPEWEVHSFWNPGHGRSWIKGGELQYLATHSRSDHWRNVLAAEGLLKPAVHTARRKPSPVKRSEPHLPTLKELAWAATPMSTMTNEQLKFMSQMTPMNLMMLKPKKRAQPLSANNLTEVRREVAARRIGRAAKKYLAAKPGRGQGPSPRSPATLARQANLGIMGGARRSPGAANNTRVTWSRNANGKISIHKTLKNLNMKLTQAERNALNNMTENQAINVIRQMARQR
jgi:hypothetical protein